MFDESSYIAALSARFNQAGVEDLGFITDTGRKCERFKISETRSMRASCVAGLSYYALRYCAVLAAA